MILGTASYMAPEQARGRAVDKRADVWAFGVVLYEMLTGARAFPGDDVSDTLATVLKFDPDWNRLPADTPAPIRRLLKRCLTKDPKLRLRECGSALLDIHEALATPERSESAALLAGAKSAASLRRSALIATAALLIGAIVGARRMDQVQRSRRRRAAANHTLHDHAPRGRSSAARLRRVAGTLAGRSHAGVSGQARHRRSICSVARSISSTPRSFPALTTPSVPPSPPMASGLPSAIAPARTQCSRRSRSLAGRRKRSQRCAVILLRAA